MVTHTENPGHILIVDDVVEVLSYISALLSEAGFRYQKAASGPQALQAVADAPPDLILLDIKMPGMNGYDVCRQLKKEPATQNIPVIFMSALTESEDKVKGFNLGGVDFISKPFDNTEVLARIKTHLELFQLRTHLEQTVEARATALAHKQALLRCVIDTIPDLIAFEDRDGAFLGCNKAFEAFTGCKESEWFGQANRCTFSTDKPQPPSTVTHGAYGIEIQSQKAWVTCANGEKVLLDTVRTPFGGSDHTPLGMVTISRDLTIQEKAQEAHQALSRQLKQAQKLEAIGTLAGGIAHDFNNILSSVIGFAELAQDEASAGSMLEDNLNEVLKAGLRAKELVSQILTFARQSDERVKPVRVSLLAKETTKLLKATLPASIEILNDLQSDALVLCDPSQMHQVFMNLCTNAFHAMESSGGYLTVKLSDGELTDALAAKDNLSLGHYLHLQISDTGAGIAPEHHNKIFDPYFTTKPQGEGTGLGLAVVHGIVTGCGGTIEMSSEIGQGTVFDLYFPIAEQEEPGVTAQPKDHPRGQERILYVDDEAPLVKINSRILRENGYEVTTSTNSLAALEIFYTDPIGFDLLLTDMTMPHMSGDQLAEKIRTQRPGIPIIICTGYAKKLSVQRVKDCGINALIKKPFTRSALLYTIREVLDSPSDPDVCS